MKISKDDEYNEDETSGWMRLSFNSFDIDHNYMINVDNIFGNKNIRIGIT